MRFDQIQTSCMMTRDALEITRYVKSNDVPINLLIRVYIKCANKSMNIVVCIINTVTGYKGHNGCKY